MKVFFDTNVLVAAFIADGTCKTVFRLAIDGEIEGVVSEQVLAELDRNLAKLMKVPAADRREASEIVRASCVVVETPAVVRQICRDPTDDPIIAAALAGAEILVTGDKDILALDAKTAGIECLRPADLLRRFD